MNTKQGIKGMHTPGPWTAEDTVSKGYRIQYDTWRVLCRVIERKEDAYLIASAPALLEACKKALPLLCDSTPSVRNAWQAVNEAINQAEQGGV